MSVSPTSSNADALAILDEAGLTAKVRNLTVDHDGQIGLVAALMLPSPDLSGWEAIFEPPYRAFSNAAPPGAKLHITDAFASGDAGWIAAANQSRSDIFSLVRAKNLLVVFTAREASVARASHQATQDMISRAKASKSPNLSVSERPSDTRLVSELSGCS